MTLTSKIGSRVARQQALRALAFDQDGYFTSRQASELGFARNNFPRFVASGAWVRERHGIYRLPDIQPARPGFAELQMWLLWTIGRDGGAPRGAIGYETALVVYGLSDLQLDRVHMVVPPTFQPDAVPRDVVLHRAFRNPTDITKHEGLLVVKPIVTLVDLLREGRVSEEHIEQALRDGLRTGEITHADMATAPPGREHDQLHTWLREIRP